MRAFLVECIAQVCEAYVNIRTTFGVRHSELIFNSGSVSVVSRAGECRRETRRRDIVRMSRGTRRGRFLRFIESN